MEGLVVSQELTVKLKALFNELELIQIIHSQLSVRVEVAVLAVIKRSPL